MSPDPPGRIVVELQQQRVQRSLKDYLSAAFDSLRVALYLFIVGVLIWSWWSTSRDDGLVVESFSVPELAKSNGLSGQVIASSLVDHMKFMRAASVRPSGTIQEQPPDSPIKVQVSGPGISIDEVYTYLRSALSNSTYVSGELYSTDHGLVLTARINNAIGPTCRTAAEHFDIAVSIIAGCVYRDYLPYFYAAFIASQQRTADAEKIFRQLAQTGTQDSRAWGYAALAYQLEHKDHKFREAIADFRAATELMPNSVLFNEELIDAEANYEFDESALKDSEGLLGIIRRRAWSFMAAPDDELVRLHYEADKADALGEFRDAAETRTKYIAVLRDPDQIKNALSDQLESLAGSHDAEGVSTLRHSPAMSTFEGELDALAELRIAVALEDWKTARAWALEALSTCEGDCVRERAVTPLVDLASAEQHDFRSADAIFEEDTDDCYTCLVVRGRIRTLEGKYGAAEYWFYRATKLGPSLPDAYLEWGIERQAAGNPEAAIPLLNAAGSRANHYADPIERVGEIILAEGKFERAAAELRKAVDYAPNWPRLRDALKCAKMQRQHCHLI
jgi:tetratricopeptide (TPR) repeat protein